jgi:hypothetical protein
MNNDDTETKPDHNDTVAVELYARRPRKPGNPTKYTPKTVTKLVSAVAEGLGLKAACVIADISYSTLMEWQREKPELAQKLEKAKEKAALEMLRRIKVAAVDDWRAAEAYLKLTRPEIFKRPQIQHQHETTHNYTQNNFITMSEERQEQLRQQVRRIRMSTLTPGQKTQQQQGLESSKNAEAVDVEATPVTDMATDAAAVTHAHAAPVAIAPAAENDSPQRLRNVEELIDDAERRRQEALAAEQQQQQSAGESSLYEVWSKTEPTPYDDEPSDGNRAVPRLR